AKIALHKGEQRLARAHLVVESGGAPVIHCQLQLAARSESVVVAESADGVETGASAAITMIGRGDIARTPGADRTNSLAGIVSYVPGAYLAHDQLHIRGGHQVSWLMDGVPIPNTNIATNAGPQFDPRDVDYFEVLRGGYPAEYGDRTYGVFNVAPRTGFERDKDGELVASFGSYRQTDDHVSVGDHTTRFAWYAAANFNRSGLGLQTPGPEVRHDRAAGVGGFSTLILNLKSNDQLRLVTSVRRDDYQIPNTPAEQASGIVDADRERDAFANLSWVHTIGPGLLLTSQYAGAQASATAVTRRHDLRLGLYGFAQRDARVFEVGQSFRLPAFRQSESPSGGLAAFFLDDRFQPAAWLTVNAGIRLTHFSGLLSENAADPRAGVAVRLPALRWTLRASYGRTYQAPPLSTVSGPALDFVLQQGLGFLPLRGERDEENQFGVTVPMGGWTFDGDHFHIHARNYFDHNAIGNSNIFLPLTVAAARVDGWEMTLRSPTLFRRGRMHLAFSRQRAQGAGSITGGLTDFSPASGYFLLDHDQSRTLSAGGDLNLPARAWAAANVYYGSGFPVEGGPARLPAHTTLDLSVGKSWEKWSLALNGLNVGNRRVLLDSSNTFGGTHYLEPRQIYGEVRYRFKL
ncbi:MAG: TonB-dependent receptor, partial [Acidobacteriia bacterium]|nr:TonB-dependent receptor [Terriglobia bacterium]